MSKALTFEKDWYIKLASKRERTTSILNDIAETNMRNLDAQLAHASERRRKIKQERELRPIDLGERLTAAEVAQRLKVTQNTIYEWINDGTIEAEHHGPTGRLIRISQKALEDYLRKR